MRHKLNTIVFQKTKEVPATCTYNYINNNMMKVILRLESENQKNQARIIDLEDEVWKINCEKEEC